MNAIQTHNCITEKHFYTHIRETNNVFEYMNSLCVFFLIRLARYFVCVYCCYCCCWRAFNSICYSSLSFFVICFQLLHSLFYLLFDNWFSHSLAPLSAFISFFLFLSFSLARTLSLAIGNNMLDISLFGSVDTRIKRKIDVCCMYTNEKSQIKTEKLSTTQERPRD